MTDQPFWRTKTLAQMTAPEWESLCDGCGRCCLIRFEDEDTGEILPTRVACRLLDVHTCACTNYPRRRRYVPDCIKLTPGKIDELTWMPGSCAYRRLHEGRDLADWHPLVSGDPVSVQRAGISVAGKVVSETAFEDVEDALGFPAPDLMGEPGEKGD